MEKSRLRIIDSEGSPLDLPVLSDVSDFDVKEDGSLLLAKRRGFIMEEQKPGGMVFSKIGRITGEITNIKAVGSQTLVVSTEIPSLIVFHQDMAGDWKASSKFRLDVQTIAVSKKPSIAYCGGYQKTLFKIDLRDGRLLYDQHRHFGVVKSLLFIEDTNKLVSADDNGDIIFWKVPSGKFESCIRPHASAVAAMRILDNKLVVAYTDGTFIQIDVRKQGCVEKTKFEVAIHCFDISADGKTVICAGGRGRGVIYDVKKKIIRNKLQFPFAVFCVAIHPNGSEMAVSGNARTVTVFSVEHPEKQISLRGHRDVVNSVCFKGANLYSSGRDGFLKVWDLKKRNLSWDVFVNREVKAMVGTNHGKLALCSTAPVLIFVDCHKRSALEVPVVFSWSESVAFSRKLNAIALGGHEYDIFVGDLSPLAQK